MKLVRALLLAVPLAFAGAAALAEEAKTVVITDDQGRKVEVAFPVKRAVVINSYANELARALGVDDRVVGQDKASVDRLPYISFNADGVVAQGTGDTPNYEAIVALRPDVVITPRNTPWQEEEAALKAFGIPVVVLTAWDTTKLHFNADLAGQLFGVEDRARELEDFYDGIGKLLAERTAGAPSKLSIYYENGSPFNSPVPGSGFHDLIVEAGANNLFGDVVFGKDGHTQGSVHGTPVNPEDLIRRNPDLVIFEAPLAFGGSDPAALEKIGNELRTRAGWSDVSAVKNGKIYVANGYPINSLSKRLGALYASVWLYPELYQDVNPDDYLRRWIVDFQRAEPPSPERYFYRIPAGS